MNGTAYLGLLLGSAMLARGAAAPTSQAAPAVSAPEGTGASSAAMEGPALERIIKSIRKRFQETKRSDNLETRQRELACETCSLQGRVEGDIVDGDLRTVELSYAEGDHCGYRRSYHWWKGELYFVFTSESCWHFSGAEVGNGRPMTKEETTEHRYYIHGGQVIRHLTKRGGRSDRMDKVPNQAVTPINISASELQREAEVTSDFLLGKLTAEQVAELL